MCFKQNKKGLNEKIYLDIIGLLITLIKPQLNRNLKIF